MLTNEDLLAISQLLDQKLYPIQSKQDRMEETQNQMQQEQSQMKEELCGIKQEQSSMKQEQRSMRFILENDVLPRLQNIESCYMSTYQRYCERVDQIDAMQADVDILKKVVHEHSNKLKGMS